MIVDFTNPETVKILLAVSAVISGFVVGLTSIAKSSGMSSNRLPLFALVMGIVLSLISVGISQWVLAVFVGMQSAFTAMGLYSGTKAVSKTDEPLG